MKKLLTILFLFLCYHSQSQALDPDEIQQFEYITATPYVTAFDRGSVEKICSENVLIVVVKRDREKAKYITNKEVDLLLTKKYDLKESKITFSSEFNYGHTIVLEQYVTGHEDPVRFFTVEVDYATKKILSITVIENK